MRRQERQRRTGTSQRCAAEFREAGVGVPTESDSTRDSAVTGDGPLPAGRNPAGGSRKKTELIFFWGGLGRAHACHKLGPVPPRLGQLVSPLVGVC